MVTSYVNSDGKRVSRWANRGRTVRALRKTDVDLVLAAQDASPQIDDRMTPDEIVESLADGNNGGLVLEENGKTAVLIVYTVTGDTALLSTLWRPRGGAGCMMDFRVIWNELVMLMKSRGVVKIGGIVSADHPRRRQLLRLYRRFGLKPDILRVTANI
jgi:hypothetical protein